ncbi:MAG: hydrolase [Flavobacteriaceae bacterium]
MKQKITFYALLFCLVLLVFQMVNSNKLLRAMEAQQSEVVQTLASTKKTKDSLQNRLDDELYFALKGNTGAAVYFPESDLGLLEQRLMDAVYEMNLKKDNNPLIPYAGMAGTFFFNKVKVLNHKWIIADFSDDTYWGEVLLGYQLQPDQQFSFTLIDHLLYPVSAESD